mmetsp:Transcript_37428/g.84492  ORF Transcript_37428/g.84492 Transcript_37428/m.84492 type:complete len:272 (+) Transcript_37428:224-1039(+)
MERSPHSARKIRREKRIQSKTNGAPLFFSSALSMSHSASPSGLSHSSEAGDLSRRDCTPNKIISSPAATLTHICWFPKYCGKLLSVNPMVALMPVITHSAERHETTARARPLRMARIMVRKKVLSPISLTKIVAKASPMPLCDRRVPKQPRTGCPSGCALLTPGNGLGRPAPTTARAAAAAAAVAPPWGRCAGALAATSGTADSAAAADGPCQALPTGPRRAGARNAAAKATRRPRGGGCRFAGPARAAGWPMAQLCPTIPGPPGPRRTET